MRKEVLWLLADKYGGVETEDFKKDLIRLQNGEPLAYIIGWVPFLHTKIFLDSKPLIPRPETEFWVSKVIEEIRSSGIQNPKILDLCAGSGCIGVAVLKEIPSSVVHFAEIDQNLHTTIHKNILENGINEGRTKIFSGDLFENIIDKYDFILSNPPYINPELSDRVEESVASHEPARALWGGVSGIEIIEKILIESPKHLNKGGVLYVEHEPEQEKYLTKLNPKVQSFKDQFGVVRYSRI